MVYDNAVRMKGRSDLGERQSVNAGENVGLIKIRRSDARGGCEDEATVTSELHAQ